MLCTIRRRTLLAAALISWSAVACRHPLAVRPGEELIQTDRQEYVADRAGGGVSLDIPFRFTNATGGPVHLPTCHGVHPPALEKWVGGAWKRAYSPALLLCLGAPKVLGRGESYDYLFRVRASPRGSNTYPQFEVAEAAGTYRLVWSIFEGDGADYMTSNRPRPLPLEERVSNSFRITE